jgi:hypothetical protein
MLLLPASCLLDELLYGAQHAVQPALAPGDRPRRHVCVLCCARSRIAEHMVHVHVLRLPRSLCRHARQIYLREYGDALDVAISAIA